MPNRYSKTSSLLRILCSPVNEWHEFFFLPDVHSLVMSGFVYHKSENSSYSISIFFVLAF